MRSMVRGEAIVEVQASLESLPWRLGTILSRGPFLRERGAQDCGGALLVRGGASSSRRGHTLLRSLTC
jgi:hypothetical protein